MSSARSLVLSAMVAAVLISSVSLLASCGVSEKELERQRQEAFCAAVVSYSDIVSSIEKTELEIPSRSDIESMSYYATEIYNNAPAEDKPALEPVINEIVHSHSQTMAAAESGSFWRGAGSLLAWTGGQIASDNPYGKARLELDDYTFSQRAFGGSCGGIDPA